MTNLIFVRHGHSEYNHIRKYAGQLDVPLTELGRQQALITAKYILQGYKIDKIFSSDLSRAIDTVQPVADALGLVIHSDKRLRELDSGEWTNEYIDVVKEKYKDEFLLFKNGGRCVGGESFLDVLRRAEECVLQIVRENPQKTILVATHAGVIRALLFKWLNYKNTEYRKVPLVSNNSLTRVTYLDGDFVVQDISYDKHLDGVQTKQDKNLI